MASHIRNGASPAFDSSLLDALAERVVIADGAMGTMLQAANLTLDDFAGLKGCNEILKKTRQPEAVLMSVSQYQQLTEAAPEGLPSRRDELPRFVGGSNFSSGIAPAR